DDKAENRTARNRHDRLAPFLAGWQQISQARRDDVLDRVGAWRRQNFAEPEQPDRDRYDADAVAQFGEIEAVTEMTGHIVDADHAEQQAEAGHQQRPDQRGRRHIGKEDQAEHEERGVFGRPEPDGDRRQWWRHNGKYNDSKRAADPGTNRRDTERRPCAALL